MPKRIILFSSTALEDMLEKGNVWYIRHYEAYFQEVYALYLTGKGPQQVTQGTTILISLARGQYHWDTLMAPFRLFRFAKKTPADIYLTADLVFAWWYALGLKFAAKQKIILMPVCMPEQIYQSTKKSLSGLPVWLERILVRLSFALADTVITGRNIKTYVAWLSADRASKKKLKIVDVLVDELPTWEFFEALGKQNDIAKRKEPVLLYVGRLHREKMVPDIVRSVSLIHQQGIKARLWLIGAGPEQNSLQKLSDELALHEYVEFLGAKKNEELVSYYRQASVFVSTLTGTALREAALCSLPIVAYKMDWIEGMLINEQNALLVEPGNITDLAKAIIRLLQDQKLAETLAARFNEYALHTWTTGNVKKAIEQILS